MDFVEVVVGLIDVVENELVVETDVVVVGMLVVVDDDPVAPLSRRTVLLSVALNPIMVDAWDGDPTSMTLHDGVSTVPVVDIHLLL